MLMDGENKNPSTITIVHNETEYTDIVPKNYKMDPETEDLIYADDLENGMRVLVAEGRLREDVAHDVNNSLILVRNRWCTVKRFRAEETGMYFIGVHDDGDMCIRQAAPTQGWLVKKDSIPVHDEETDESDFVRVQTAEGVVELPI